MPDRDATTVDHTRRSVARGRACTGAGRPADYGARVRARARSRTAMSAQAISSANAGHASLYRHTAATPAAPAPAASSDKHDAVIFFNYRTDRTRQLTAAFTEPEFSPFKTVRHRVHFVCMGPYSKIAPVAFAIPEVKNNLTQWLSAHHIRQLRVAETEKYAHVTFFFNSQIETPAPGEDRILVPSHKVASYAERPEMSAMEITETVVESLKKADHPVIIVNYANGDLVGHSGNLKATIKAIETLDECLGKLHTQAMASGYTLLLTADHGNADDMLYSDGSPKPAHSMNPVIFLAADPEGKIKKVRNGGLSDVAPTLLKLLGLKKPKEMTGKELI